MGRSKSIVAPPVDRGTSDPGLWGPGPRIRVLVVDDDPRVRAAIGQTIAFEADLFLVASTAGAATTLAVVAYAEPSVALVDVTRPGSDKGLDLVRTLAHRPGCTVVAMSIDGGRRESALAAGAVVFVEKDGDIDSILDAVRAAATLRR